MATLTIHFKNGSILAVETDSVNFLEGYPRLQANRMLYLHNGRKQTVALAELERFEVVIDSEGADLLAGYPALK